MTAIHVPATDTPAALLNPETTADKRTRRYNVELERRGKRPKQTERVIPGLDVAALAAKYGGDPANTTQTRIGVFKVPIGISLDKWRCIRNVAVERFTKALEGQGWVIARIEVNL